MNKVLYSLLGLLFVIALLGWQHFQISLLKLEQSNSQEKLDQQSEKLRQNHAAIKQLTALADKKERQARALEQQQQALQKHYEQQKEQLKEVHHAQENKEWATTDLPSAIKQLRHRPRLYSASDYYQFVQHTQPLPIACPSTENQ